MAGRGKPPEGTPDGAPGGDDDFGDEYRSVVFDESFVKAAPIQEFSARERLEDGEHTAVRSRPELPPGSGRTGITASRQGIVLVLLIALAFGTAIYMGFRTPYRHSSGEPNGPMRYTVLPLAPREPVPGSTPGDLYAHSPASRFRTGDEGVTLPAIHRTPHFSESQVEAALTTAKEYVFQSSLNESVLTGGAIRPVRDLLDPSQYRQFDQSVDAPRNDGRHAATAWMVRFDPSKVELAASSARVSGSLSVQETDANSLEITADHVIVYALRPAAAGKGSPNDRHASLFTIRREVRFHVDRQELRQRHQRLAVEQVSMRAGPLPCSADPSDSLSPLLAGERAKDDQEAGTDPYAWGRSGASMCGVLSGGAQPSPDPS